MSDFTQIVLSIPVIVPPTPQINYDKGWIDTITITSPCVNKIQVYAKIVPCRDNPDTCDKELKPNLTDNDIRVMTVDNVWDIIGTNPKFGMAMELIFQSVLEYGQQIGVFLDTDESSSSSSSSSMDEESSSFVG